MNRGILFLCTGNACRSQMAEGFRAVRDEVLARIRVLVGSACRAETSASATEVLP
jgi:protein-tyrosine-phosphatase